MFPTQPKKPNLWWIKPEFIPKYVLTFQVDILVAIANQSLELFLFQCNAKCFVPIGAHLNGLTRFPDFVDGSIMLDGMFKDTASTEGKKCFNSPQFWSEKA